MFAINDIVVLIDLDYDSYVRSEGFKETGVIVKVLNTQGSAIKVESTGTGFWLRIGAFRMASPAEKEAYNTGLRSIRDIKSADLTGRYIKALISAPYGGMVDKGEYGKITDHSGLNGCYVDFPSHRRYYWTDLKEASKGELMPLGFDPMSDQVTAKPASLYPDYARCTKAYSTAYTFNKIYPVNKDGDIEDNNGTYSTTSWKSKGNGNSDFEASSKEAFVSHGTKTLINPFKKGDVVMVDHSKIGTSFYSNARSICSGLVADKRYVIDQLTDNGAYYTAGTFFRLEGEAYYVHPYDIFYLAPKETIPKVTTTEARRRYPIGTSFISPENGKTYKVRSHTYGDNGFYEAGKDILCRNETTSGGQFVYLNGKWADSVSVSTVLSDELTSLPSKWCIQRTDEAANIVNKWFTDNGYGSPYMTNYNYICRLGDSYEAHSNPKAGYTVITLQQFKDWVMTKPTKKEDKADATKQSVRPSDDLEFQKPILVKRVKSKSKLVIIN